MISNGLYKSHSLIQHCTLNAALKIAHINNVVIFVTLLKSIFSLLCFLKWVLLSLEIDPKILKLCSFN